MCIRDRTNATNDEGEAVFHPFARDENLIRPWAIPGADGLMHRVGGLEKDDGSGNVSYDPQNHARMTELRKERIDIIANDIPLTSVEGDVDADVLILGWGSTWGAITGAVRRLRADGHKVANAHLTHIHPFPKDLGEVLARYKTVVVPELNMGQLVKLVRAEFLVDAKPINKVMGQPFTAGELEREVLAHIENAKVS